MHFFIALVAAIFISVFLPGAAAAQVSLELHPQCAGVAGGDGDAAPVADARLIGEVAAGAAAGRWGPAPDFNRRFRMVRTGEAPVIDGAFDEAAWETAPVLCDFVAARSFNDSSLPPYAKNKTEARVLFDEKGLYVAVKAWQAPSTIYTDISKNGLLRPDLDWQFGAEQWANTGCDEIEIAIDPELTQTSHYIFHVNPDGVMQKSYMPHARVWDGWNKRIDPVIVADDDWRAVVSRDDEGWYAEIFIPFSSVGWREMKPSEPNEVFFDMAQDRTVMGFNVHRVAHVDREPSSWSPSHGAMFFRDAEHFGHAYFRPTPASLGRTDCGDFAAGEARVEAQVVSRSDEGLALAVEGEVSGEGYQRSTREDMLLRPGTSETVQLEVETPPPGRYSLAIRLLGEDGYLMDAARYLFEVPEPVEVCVEKSVLYEGETDLPVRVAVNGPRGAVEGVRFSVVRDGEVLAETSAHAGALSSEVYPFEVNGLDEGSYEFTVELVSDGATTASASAGFSVIEDPFSLELSGRAGEGGGFGGEAPESFTVLAGSDGREAREESCALPGWVDEAMLEKGFVVYAVPATADFYTGGGMRSGGGAAAPPRRAQLSAPVRAFAAGGEYEAVSFAVFALRDIENPVVEFTAARSAAGQAIPETHLVLRAERPDRYLVEPGTLGGLPAGAGRRYFLTAYVPPGTPAGIYEGSLSIAVGEDVEQRPYSLLVLPFALGESPITAGIYGSFRGNELDRALAADILAHGMDAFTNMNVLAPNQTKGARTHNIIWGIEKPTGEGWLGNDPQRFSTELDENIYRHMAEYGLRGPIVVDASRFVRYTPCTPENAGRFREFIAKIEAMRERFGLPEFVYHLVDEPNNHFTYDDGRYGRRYGIQRVRFFGEVLSAMGLRQYVTINSTQRGYDIGEKAVEACAIWVPNYISDGDYVSKWLRRGSEVWLYNYAGDGACKGAMRSSYGFYPLSIGATGVTIWHYASFVRFVRGEGRLLTSSAWEAAREGVDDARYAATLAAAIDRARSAGGERERLAAAAAGEMEAILSAYPAPTGEKVAFEERHDADDWNKWRWIIARWIVRLVDAS